VPERWGSISGRVADRSATYLPHRWFRVGATPAPDWKGSLWPSATQCLSSSLSPTSWAARST